MQHQLDDAGIDAAPVDKVIPWWLGLLACGGDGETESRHTGPNPLVPECELLPCVRDLAAASFVRSEARVGLGSTLIAWDDVVIAGAPGWVEQGQAPTGAHVLDVATLAERGRWEGAERGDFAGYALAVADLEQDGVPEVAVGSPSHVDGGFTGGRAVLLSGLPSGTTSLAGRAVLTVLEPSTPGEVQTDDGVGASLAFLDAGAGVELVVGVPGQDELWFYDPGLRGTVGRAEATRVLDGANGAGLALTTWDGRCDGTAGLVVTGLGGVAWFEVPLAPEPVDGDASATWELDQPSDGDLGQPVHAQRDLDGDGCADLVMGASSTHWPPERAGAVYVVLGGDPVSSDATELPVQVKGGVEGEGLGSAVEVADLDGDGTPELVVGSQSVQGGPAGGTVRVFAGPVSGSYAPADADHIVHATRMFDRLGTAMVVVDADGDARDDLVVGAAHAWGGGAAYLILGADWLP